MKMNFWKSLFGKTPSPPTQSVTPPVVTPTTPKPQVRPVPQAPPAPQAPKASLIKSHPMFERILTQAEIDAVVGSGDYRRIMEVLIFSSNASSIRMSISVGFYHRYGCMEGLMIHQRDYLQDQKKLELVEAFMSFDRELTGTFRCNRCGAEDKLSVSWLKDGHEKGYFPLSAPPDDPLMGVILARQQLVR